METKIISNTVITAAEGKALRRKSDGWMAGKELYLGYTYYLNGKKLDHPFLEKPEDYEEIDAPAGEEEE